ncbi:alpha-galactosidase, partial [Pseudomonas viridiflava]|uniref:alpha-galactosidase n=1 Tax=Pseudomonas viridiflava TaxID=33069 RepID=UPI0019D16E8C
AEAAASVGVERFVLDDGWFRGRPDDRSGLGDWFIDDATWPEGLRPLADQVHGLGMQFGLWFEPEMVNPVSDLVAQHPDWVLQAAPDAPTWRH